MRTQGSLGWPVVLALVVPGLVCSQQALLPDFSVPQGMVSRDFPLGFADAAVVEQLCRETLSAGGKYHVFKTTRRLRVIGIPGEVETIAAMLPHLSQPPANVKIEFLARGVSGGALEGLHISGEARGRGGNVVIGGDLPGSAGGFRRNIGAGERGDLSRPVAPNSLRVGRPRGGAIEVDILNQRTGGASLSSQFVLVRSGSEGFIEVARDVPMIDYFTRFVADGSYGAVLGVVPFVAGNPHLLVLAGGHFEAPQIRWEKEGSRLLVQPVVEGQLIHLTIMPQLSAVRIVDPAVFRERGLNTFLTGREQYVTYMELATAVTVQSGQEVSIGGFAKAGPEFNRFFFGGGAGSAAGGGSFTVRATIQ